MLPGMCGACAAPAESGDIWDVVHICVGTQKFFRFQPTSRREIISIGATYSPGSRAAPVIAHISQLHLMTILDSDE